MAGQVTAHISNPSNGVAVTLWGAGKVALWGLYGPYMADIYGAYMAYMGLYGPKTSCKRRLSGGR